MSYNQGYGATQDSISKALQPKQEPRAIEDLIKRARVVASTAERLAGQLNAVRSRLTGDGDPQAEKASVMESTATTPELKQLSEAIKEIGAHLGDISRYVDALERV